MGGARVVEGPAQRPGQGGALPERERAEQGAAVRVRAVGRVQDGALLFDLRCLEDEPGFRAQLEGLDA